MAARKKPQTRKTPAKPTAKAAPLNKARSGKMGITGDRNATKLAQKSITRQYGMVKDASGNWVKPDKDFLERQLSSQGYGVGQTAVNPVNIGGYRWLTGAGKLKFTGKRSDAAKRNPGAPYNPAAGAAGGIAPSAAASLPGSFASGVSGATQAFIKEFGQSRLAEGESEAGKAGGTKKKKKGKGKKKPAKRTVKKTPAMKRKTPVKRTTARPRASARLRYRTKKK